MLTNISVEEAQQQILNHIRPLNEEHCFLLEAAGRVCSCDILADADLPPFAQSAVDGYAVAEPAANGQDTYWITGYLQLGDHPLTSLQTGQAIGVLTGGNLPPGTRAVIPHEKVVIEDNSLKSLEEIKTGNNIKQAGEDFVKGEVLVNRGAVLEPAHIALLAAYGKDRPPVYRQPRVMVLSLSRHVVEWYRSPEDGQIRDSNGPMLAALLQKSGAQLVSLETVADRNPVELKTWLEESLPQVDMLVITGGTYAEGDNETHLLLEAIGAEILYWDVALQPGSHTGAALWNSCFLLALSGNPAACAVGYQLFAVPALRAMQGLSPNHVRSQAKCRNGFTKKSGSRRFVRGHVTQNEGLQVTVLPGQKPSMIRSLLDCNALIDLPAGSPPIESGSEVSIIWLDQPFKI